MASLKIDANMSAVAYHVSDGATVFPYAIDAHSAVSRFPDEWSHEPWSQADADAARQRAKEKYDRDVAEAKARNLPVPPPPAPPPPEPTPEEQAAIMEHDEAVAAAKERLRVAREKAAKKKAEEDQIAADEALVASVPPRPEPNARRPLSPAQIRKNAATLSPEEQKMVDDKAEADRQAAANVTNTSPAVPIA